MPNVKSAMVGLENLCYAPLVNEDTNTYGSVVSIAPAITAKIKPKVNTAILYGDNMAVDTATALGEIEVELEITALSQEIVADLLGHSINSTTGVITYDKDDIAPYIALGFKSKKANGKFRSVWLLKGKFEEVEEEYATTEDKPKFQTPKIKATFVIRADGLWKYTADEDAGSSPVSTFLDTVYSPTADLVAPTVSCVPTDTATGVAVDANIVLTFNKAIEPSTAIASNIFLMKADGTAVACALSIGTNNTVVTLNPNSNLSASTDYVAVVTTAVKSADYVSLVANAVFNFTTA
jgi:phi13 family phage major tail protein